MTVVNLTLYAASAFVEGCGDQVTATLNDISISDVVSELGTEQILAEMDLSDIVAYVEKVREEDEE